MLRREITAPEGEEPEPGHYAEGCFVGAALLAKVRKPEEVQLRAWLLQFLKAEVTRQADVTRILPLINELEALPEQWIVSSARRSPSDRALASEGEEAEVNQSPG